MKFKREELLIVAAIVFLASANDAPSGFTRRQCHSSLQWAPILTKKPYTTFLNSAFCPSWTTRAFFTKRSQYTHINLPIGLPFSPLCGACYTGTTNLARTLTLTQEIDGDAAKYNLQQAQIQTRDGHAEHLEREHKCMIQYGISNPIKYSGRFKCAVRLGKFSKDEIVTYSVKSMTVTKTEETMEVREPTVTLTCPSHPDKETIENPLIHVWYEQTDDGPAMVAPTNNPQVTFRLSSQKSLVVSCATYHIMWDNTAYEHTYTVRRISTGSYQADPPASSSSTGIDKSVHAGDLDYAADYDTIGASIFPEGKSLNAVMVVIISITGVLLFIIAVVSVIRCILSTNNRRATRRQNTNNY